MMLKNGLMPLTMGALVLLLTPAPSQVITARAQSGDKRPAEDKLVYNIVDARILPFGLENGRLLLSLEGRVPLSNPPTPDQISRLEDEANWNIRTAALVDITDSNGNVMEPRGSVSNFRPQLVRVSKPYSSKLVRFLIGRSLDPAKYRVTVSFNQTVEFPTDTILSQIEVEFGESMPEEDSLVRPGDWLVRKTNLEDGRETRIPPRVLAVDRRGRTVLLLIPGAGKLDLEKERYVVRYNQPNFPEFTLGEPKKLGSSKVFTAAKGPDDADIYFSGSVVGARKSKPVYNYEAKVGYLFSTCVRCGSIGPRASVKAAGESNIDPDSIKFSATYENVFVLAPVRGIILRSDFIGSEFDTGNRTRNLSTGLDAIYVMPAYKMREGNYFTMDFLFGFEGGHNYRHKLSQNGLGNYWRWKFGSNAYFVALGAFGLERLNISAEYETRILRSFEPFTETIDGKEVTTLRKKPRHYVGTDVDFMFSDAFGVTVKYRYGSLPPAFNFVNNSVSAGLTFQLKQANR